MSTRVIALQDYGARLKQKVGRDQWEYDGTPEAGAVIRVQEGDRIVAKIVKSGTRGATPVWMFQFEQIERDVQRVMIRETMRSHQLSLREAEAFLRSVPQCIPVLDVMLIHEDTSDEHPG